MHKTTLVLTLLVAVLLTPAVSGAVELEEILQMNLEARGGLERLKSATAFRMRGKITMGQIEAPMLIEAKRPSRFRMEFTVQGMIGIQAFDGETAWMLMPFMGKTEPEVMSDEQAKEMREQADFDGILVDWKEKGNTVELVGTGDVEGTDAHKLKVTLPSGDATFVYLDPESGIALQHETTSKVPGQGTEKKVVVTFSDYKEVEGLMIAHSMETTMGGQVVAVTTIDTVEVNPDISDDRFTMPEFAAAKPTASED